MFLKRLRQSSAGMVGLVIVLAFAVVAVVAPLLAPHGPFELAHRPLLGPGEGGALMGSDPLGRDTFSQFLHGARVAFLVGMLAALMGLLIGVLVGAVSGYLGGRVDAFLMRVTEMFQVTPRFILALAIVAIIGPGLDRIIFVIGILSWPPAARVIRAQFLSLREQEFTEASRVLGLSRPRIIFGELVPNAAPAAIVIGSLDVAQAILLEAGLSFLGLGDPDLMSWGIMLHNAQGVLRQAPWLSIFPGLAVFLLVLGFNVLGDGVNDALDPKQRVRRGSRRQ